MSQHFRFLPLLLAALLCGLAAPAQEPLPLRILHYNDFHSQNLPSKVSGKDEQGNKATIEVGGLAYLRTAVDLARAGQPNALLLHAGDDFQGTPVSAMTKGRSQIELLELMQPDAMTLGNHEFDYGADNLRALFPLKTFPIVSANLFDKSTGAPFVPRYRVVERGGVRMGIIGMAPVDLKRLTLRDNVRDIDVLETEVVLRHTMAELRRNFQVDLIVVLSHMGVEIDTMVARTVPGIDVIVGGHSHTALFKPLHAGDTWVVQAGAKGRWLGQLDVLVDTAANRVVKAFGKLIEVRCDRLEPHPVVAAAVEAAEGQVSAALSERIGTLETDWLRSHGPAESNVGNWMSDCIRDYAQADIGLQNSGGIRKDLPAGPVTYRDIWEISPFGNEIVRFRVSGEQLRRMFLFQAKKSNEFCQVGGIAYSYVESPDGSAAFSISVGGRDVEDERIYTVATNSFVGGHLFDFFTLPEASIVVETVYPPAADRDIFIAAIKRQPNISSRLEGRITIKRNKP